MKDTAEPTVLSEKLEAADRAAQGVLGLTVRTNGLGALTLAELNSMSTGSGCATIEGEDTVRMALGRTYGEEM